MPTIESAARQNGIHYVTIIPTAGEPEVAGDTAYAEIVAETIKLAALTPEPRVKVILAKDCVEVHKHPTKTIVVVYRQGDAIVKSMQRMLRKLARAKTESRKQPPLVDIKAQVAAWPHPAGTPVRYWPGARDDQPRRGTTTTAAKILSGHTAGLYIAGAGFIALTHVEFDDGEFWQVLEIGVLALGGDPVRAREMVEHLVTTTQCTPERAKQMVFDALADGRELTVPPRNS